MEKWQIIVGVLLFAVVASILYMWGLKKALNQREKLASILYNKSANKVVSYLKKNDCISLTEVKKLIEGIKASEFYSKNKAVITDTNSYSTMLTEKMIEQNIIERVKKDGKTSYKLVIKEKEIK